MPIWITLFLAGTWALIPVWAGRFLMPRWLTLCSKFFVMDAQLSQRLLPQRINPNGYWLVLRHGVPQATILHWTHWSPLQLGFFVIMLAVTVTCIFAYPGFPLTRPT